MLLFAENANKNPLLKQAGGIIPYAMPYHPKNGARIA